jgi:hypothetical protein
MVFQAIFRQRSIPSPVFRDTLISVSVEAAHRDKLAKLSITDRARANKASLDCSGLWWPWHLQHRTLTVN